MVERQADLAAQIESVRQLAAVVTAMRGIAASRAQKGRSLLPGIDAYAAVVSGAIGQALNLLPADGMVPLVDGKAHRGIILFCGEQGFVGAFNERVLDAAAHEPPGTTIFLLGTRGATLAAERGLPSAWHAPMATHAEAIPELANRLAEALYGRVTREGLARVDVVFPRAISAGGIEIDRHSLMPIDFSRFPRPGGHRVPLINLPPALLLERLASEYIFGELCRAAVHAFEAESEARILAMGSARASIERALSDLSQRERQMRQQEITAEILELAAGAEASEG